MKMRPPSKIKRIINNGLKSKIISNLLILFKTDKIETKKMCKKTLEKSLCNQMEDEIKLIQKIANKTPTYNKDINQHIETCRISLSIIEQKESTIRTLREMLEQRDKQIILIQEDNLELRKQNFIERTGRVTSEKEYREVLSEQYKIIEDLKRK